MKNIFLTLLFGIIAFAASAQQLPDFTPLNAADNATVVCLYGNGKIEEMKMNK